MAIDEPSTAAKSRLRAPDRPRADLQEACRAVLCQLARAVDSAGDPLRTLGVASACRGEGASTVAAHLAMQAAEVCPGQVLLVDAHESAPCLHAWFHRPVAPGFCDALAAPDQVLDFVQPTPVDNLSLLAAGNAGRREAVFDADGMDSLATRVAEQFSLTIFDLPPAGEASSALAIAANAGGVLLVVEANRATGRSVRRAADRLRRSGARVIGAVMNKCPRTR